MFIGHIIFCISGSACPPGQTATCGLVFLDCIRDVNLVCAKMSIHPTTVSMMLFLSKRLINKKYGDTFWISINLVRNGAKKLYISEETILFCEKFIITLYNQIIIGSWISIAKHPFNGHIPVDFIVFIVSFARRSG